MYITPEIYHFITKIHKHFIHVVFLKNLSEILCNIVIKFDWDIVLINIDFYSLVIWVIQRQMGNSCTKKGTKKYKDLCILKDKREKTQESILVATYTVGIFDLFCTV